MDAKDDAYINNVIIPEENVITRTNEIHLIVILLYRNLETVRDSAKIKMDIVIGLMFPNDAKDNIKINETIFL